MQCHIEKQTHWFDIVMVVINRHPRRRQARAFKHQEIRHSLTVSLRVSLHGIVQFDSTTEGVQSAVASCQNEVKLAPLAQKVNAILITSMNVI